MEHFLKEQVGAVVYIRCRALLDKSVVDDFKAQAKAWLLSPVDVFVLDLACVQVVTKDFYCAVIQLRTNLKREDKKLFSLNVSKTLARQLIDDGVEKVFSPVASVADAVASKNAAPSSAGRVEVGFINPFLNATVNTLTVQAQTPVRALKPFLKKEVASDVAIAGVISLISKGYSGSIVLCFSEKVFLKIYENMLGEKHEKITLDVQDAAGELLNIIYGMAKTELNEAGYDFQKALPTVLAAERLAIRQSGQRAIVVPFESDAGNFHLEIEFNLATGGVHV